MAFKSQTMTTRLEAQTKEYEGAGQAPSTPAPPDGANVKEIKEAWRYTEDTRNRDFNERLPKGERDALKQGMDRANSAAVQFDQAQGPSGDIEGVYLEQTVPA